MRKSASETALIRPQDTEGNPVLAPIRILRSARLRSTALKVKQHICQLVSKCSVNLSIFQMESGETGQPGALVLIRVAMKALTVVRDNAYTSSTMLEDLHV